MKITTILSLALAAAAGSVTAQRLQKRDTEMIYLANCVSSVSCCTPDINWSEIIYYARSADSNNQEVVPPDSNRCRVTNRGSGFTMWEGNQKSCRFSSGVTFAEAIDRDAQDRGVSSYAGWGWNGKTWTCYKGDKRWIFAPYQPEAVTGCTNIYYCVPA